MRDGMGEETMVDNHQEEAEHSSLGWPEKNFTWGHKTARLMVGPVFESRSPKLDVFSVST